MLEAVGSVLQSAAVFPTMCFVVLCLLRSLCSVVHLILLWLMLDAPFGNVLLRTVFPVFLLGSVFLVFSLHSPLCSTVLDDA